MAQDTDFARILVVDDDAAMRTLIHRVLAPVGYHVNTAATVAEARAMEPDGYDVVLVDAHLGRDRGADFIQELVAANPGMARRCLMITGGSPDAVPEGVGCLLKPFRPQQLLDAVGSLRRPGASGSEVGQAAGLPSSTGGSSPEITIFTGQAGTLLALNRMLRIRERLELADLIHDGPAQELSAAVLYLHLIRGQLASDQLAHFDSAIQQVEAVAVFMRSLIEKGSSKPPAETRLAETIRDRTAWLLASPAVVDLRPSFPQLDVAQTALIADITELMLLLIAAGVSSPSARVSVQAGDETVQIGVDVTAAIASRPAGDGDPAMIHARLRELSSALAASVRVESGPRWLRAQITLPSGNPEHTRADS